MKGSDVLGHMHTHTPVLTAEGGLSPNISLWVSWGPEPVKAGPWGPGTGAPHPRSMEWGQASGVLKALRVYSGRKGFRRPQTASDVLETQSWQDSYRALKPVVNNKICF